MLKNLKQTDTNSPRPTAHQVLVNEPPRLRLVIPHQVVMQPGLFIEVLVLQSERLMRIPIDALILFQTTPGGVSPYHRRLPWMSVISRGMPIWSVWK